MFYCSFVSIHYIICECGDTFPTEEALKAHLERDHQKKLEENEYKCETCEKVFASARACLVHQRVHTAPRTRHPRSPRTPREQRDSRDKRQLKKSYNAKNIVCEVCGKRYSSNAALGYHQRVHTGERPYQCSLCPKTFTMPLFLQIHTRTHTGEKPYECPHCPKAFSNKAALLRHDRVHTGIKPYGCPKCGKYFTQSNSMKLHVKTVHLKMPAPYKSKSRRIKEMARKGLLEGQVQVQVQNALLRRGEEEGDEGDGEEDAEMEMGAVKTEVKAEAEPLDGDGTYHVYYDQDVYGEGAQLYHEVEIGHPEITMYEVDGQEENVEVLYQEEGAKEEVLYHMGGDGEDEGEGEDGGRVLYEVGDRGEMLEVLYQDEDRDGDVQYEEVYEEAM